MIQIAVMGFGTVGAGVAEVLQTNGALLEKRLGEAVALKYILDIRDFPDSPFGALVAHDFETIVNDPELDVVVETIGGAGIAYEYTRRALLAGKHVVTSNKELVATRGRELLTLAEEKNVNYLFEASVGGGIPILRPLQQCLAANEIEEVFGILNGTTNYILTRMVRSGITFEAALKEAQAMGMPSRIPPLTWRGRTPAARSVFWRIWPLAGKCCPSRCPPRGFPVSRCGMWRSWKKPAGALSSWAALCAGRMEASAPMLRRIWWRSIIPSPQWRTCLTR